MLDKDYRKIHRRIKFVMAFLFLLFVLVALRAYSLQMVEGEKLSSMASNQTLGRVVIQPRRGQILDRKKRVLASNAQAPSLTARPATMTRRERELAKDLLKKFFKTPERTLRRLDGKRHFVWLHRRVTEDKAEVFRQIVSRSVASFPDEEKLQELAWLDEDQRVYPAARLASPVLGFTDIDNRGRMGIESEFNESLCGESIELAGFKTPSGRQLAVSDISLSLDVPTGDNIVLTLDRSVQFISEKVIADTVAEFNARAGIVIVMDPSCGAILAMAQSPTFDSNDLSDTDLSNVHNFAIEHGYEPGSTLKPVVVASALEEGLVVPDERIDCENGSYKVPGKIIHDSKPYGELTVRNVLAKSSNIGMAKIGARLGRERLYRTLIDFGFGKRTEIRLPAETKGLLRPGDTWVPLELATISFGQGLTATPLQLATAIAAIANGGKLIRPRIVERLEAPDGSVVEEFHPEIRRRLLSEHTAKLVREMMEMAVADGGTGTQARIKDCDIAGKTGTSEKLSKNAKTNTRDYWTSSFVGYLPARNPKLLILVMVDEPKGKYYGGDVAAPAFRRIAEEIAPMLGVCTQPGELARVEP